MLLTMLIGTLLASCDKEGEIIYTTGADIADLQGNTADIVLNIDQLDALVLTIYWNENGDISFSNPNVAAPSGAVTNTIQFSVNEDFSNTIDESMSQGVYYRQFTCRELNSIAKRLGCVEDVKSTLYIRISSSIGSNITPVISNTLAINVTPYAIDMTIGYYLNSSQEATDRYLNSPEANGIYSGFIGAGSWENWWLREGDGTIWGNDGETGTAFVLGNSNTGNTVWNFWYPGQAGCYYTIVNTKANEWSALYIPELNLGGDISGNMVFDSKANKWTYTYNSTNAGTINVTISGIGKQYNVNTNTDDAAAIDTPVAFFGNSEALSFGQSASNISVQVPSAGEVTIALDLNNPNAWKLSVEEGAPEPEEKAASLLYLSGVYGDWTFNWYVKLYNEDNLNYGAALPVNSEWGYKIYPEAHNWDSFYTMVAGGNAYEGSLVYCGEGNIAAPEEGFYLFDISLSAMTYKVSAITKVSYTGLNDDWSLTEMSAGDKPGIYTATVTKSANTPWGVKIVLNDNWDMFFGGNGTPGELALFQDGFEGDNDLDNGTYTLTVDLSKCTYSYSK